MKKQLLTGALALSMMLGTTGMAMAADAVNVEMEKLDVAAVPMQSVAISTTDSTDAAIVSDGAFTVSDMKLHTVETYQAEIKEVKTGLDEAVKAKQLTLAEADQIIAQMEQELTQIKNGTLKLYYADMLDKDGKIVGQVSMVNAVSLTEAADGQNAVFTVTAK